MEEPNVQVNLSSVNTKQCDIQKIAILVTGLNYIFSLSNLNIYRFFTHKWCKTVP